MAANATSKTGAIPSQPINEVLQEAMLSYEKALKAGIQFQEESVNLWKELLAKIGNPENLGSKFDILNSGVHADARKSLDEIIATFNRSSQRTMDLFQKAAPSASCLNETQEQLHKIVESSLSNLHSNIQGALSMNAKILNSWNEIATNLASSSK